jgi:short-subunit dehydrogenase
MDLGLRGKVAVITGASIGIGLAVAEGLAAEGANIVMNARQEDRLRKEARRVAKKYKVKTLAVDNTDAAER